MEKENKQIIVYQAQNGAVEVQLDAVNETILLTQLQVAQLFNVQKGAISKHVKNIFVTRELERASTVSVLETVQTEGKRKISRKVEYYNLDLVLSIGYRVNSINATRFRQWATKTLKQHIIKGYTLNRRILEKNYDTFLKALNEVQELLPESQISAQNALELIKTFASTWLSLDTYDRDSLPKSGKIKSFFELTASQVNKLIVNLKEELIGNKEASLLFGSEKEEGILAGIIRAVFQTFNGKELYPTVEEKAANLLYLIVKDHPFIDGNKRSGAFVFIWFLKKTNVLNTQKLTPEALTALTILVAESTPKDKDRIIGLILMLLR